MDSDELVKVFTTTSEGEAEVVRLMLEDEGIRASVSGSAQGGFAGILEVHVYVRSADAVRATSIVENSSTGGASPK